MIQLSVQQPHKLAVLSGTVVRFFGLLVLASTVLVALPLVTLKALHTRVPATTFLALGMVDGAALVAFVAVCVLMIGRRL